MRMVVVVCSFVVFLVWAIFEMGVVGLIFCIVLIIVFLFGFVVVGVFMLSDRGCIVSFVCDM